MRTLPSTLMSRCIMMLVTSLRVKAYLSLFLRKTMSGKHSRSLCGPADGLGACVRGSSVESWVRELVQSGGRAHPGARELVEHPVLRRRQALQVLLRSASHLCDWSVESRGRVEGVEENARGSEPSTSREINESWSEEYPEAVSTSRKSHSLEPAN